MKKGETLCFGNLLGTEDRLPRECIDRFVGFDPAEAGILVAEIPEAGDQHPFERILPPIVDDPPLVSRLFQRLLQFLVTGTFAHHGPERGGDDPFAPFTNGVADLGNGGVPAAAAVDRFRRHIVFHHDRWVHRHKVHLCNVLMVPHHRLEDKPSTVGEKQCGRRFEFFRFPFLGGDEVAVPVRPGKLHRGESGPDGGT